MENKEILKKVKNVYYDETGKFAGGNYATGLVIELEDGRMFRAQSSDVIMAFEQIKQPLERIPEEIPIEPILEKNVSDGEETRPTGEEELRDRYADKLYGISLGVVHDRNGQPVEFCVENIDNRAEEEILDFIREQLSLAREEGRKKQAELDRKIYGMSVEEFNENYKAVEPLQNGERERVEQILDYYVTKSDCYTYNSIVSQKRRKMLKSEIEDLLSQSKKECEEELVASKLLWERMNEWQKEWRAENPKERELTICDGLKLIEWKIAQSKKEELEYLIEEYGEVDTPYLSMLPHEIPEERERLERLTNQKKDI